MGQSKKRPSDDKKDTAAANELPAGNSAQPRPNRFLIAAVAFASALAGYMFTLARTVTLVDSGELIAACASLGVAHPPGFPLYTLIGYLFSKLPFGSTAARLSFMSAFFAALASAAVALIAFEINEIFSKSQSSDRKLTGKAINKDSKENASGNPFFNLFNLLMPVSIGLTFAFSLTLWFYASVAEVYSLNIALLAIIFYLMLHWHRVRSSSTNVSSSNVERLPIIAAGVYGLALGVHHVTILLTLPALALLVWRTAGKKYFAGREMALAFGAVLLGASIYLYLPLAASRNPVMNWGAPADFDRFYKHVSGWQYQVNLFSGDFGKTAEQIAYFLRLLFLQFTPAGLAGAFVGLFALWKRNRTILLFLAAVIVFDVAYGINYEIAEDKDSYYLSSFLAFACALAAGARSLFDWASSKETRFSAAILLLLIALPVGCFSVHYFENNKRNYFIARDYVENALKSVEPNGLLLTLDWQFYSPYFYLRHIENFRRDATVVDVNLLRRSWYIEGYMRSEFPEMMKACETEASEFLEDLKTFESGKNYDVARINDRFKKLINAFIKYHMPSRPAYTMLPMEEGVGTEFTWVPQGLVFKFYQDQLFRPEPAAPLELRGFIDGSVHLDEVADGKVRLAYATMIANRGRYLGAGGRYDEALSQLRLALQLNPEMDRAYEFMGDAYYGQGKTDFAIEAYKKALSINPSNSVAQQRLSALGGK